MPIPQEGSYAPLAPSSKEVNPSTIPVKNVLHMCDKVDLNDSLRLNYDAICLTLKAKLDTERIIIPNSTFLGNAKDFATCIGPGRPVIGSAPDVFFLKRRN